MRGKLDFVHHTISDTGNIPAYAGKTHPGWRGAEDQKEHPRVCGENLRTVTILGFGMGTSPRMRGKRGWGHDYFVHERNIPAYAGKTLGILKDDQEIEEHPRVCGENQVRAAEWELRRGTSPRMRGKHLLTCGSSFLRVILHSILFFCTVGGSMESPLQLPPV